MAMVEAGSNIQAIGRFGYVVTELVDLNDTGAFERIEAVAAEFPDRDQYKMQIIDCLHNMGRIAEC